MGRYMWVQVYLEAKSQLWYLSSKSAIHLIFGDRVSQWDLGLTEYSLLLGQLVRPREGLPGSLPRSLPQHWDCKYAMASFFTWLWIEPRASCWHNKHLIATASYLAQPLT